MSAFSGFVQNQNQYVTDPATGDQLVVNPDGSINATFKPALSDPLGYQQLAVGNTAIGLTVPSGAQYAIIQNDGAPSVRWRDDGVAPTNNVGMTLQMGAQFTYDGDLDAIEFIRNTGAATATVNISYYKYV